MDDMMYHNCRWCRYNVKGSCVKSSEGFEGSATDSLYEIAESGKLSEAITEGLRFPKFEKLESLLVEYGISQKRQKEILQTVKAELEDNTLTMVEGVDDSVSRLILSYEADVEDLELKDPESFYCKYFE